MREVSMSILRQSFEQLQVIYSGEQQLALDLWQEIESAYSSPDRHYHNLSHLAFMLGHFNEHKTSLKDPDAVLFAIYYHDIVWEAGRKDNEAQSAKLAMRRLKELNVPRETRNRCNTHILCTIHHQPSEDPDTAWLVDFDLAILGTRPERYQQFVDGIRKEFAQFEGPIFDQGRAAMIQKMLGRKYIFLTGVYRTLHESTARKNLSKELKTLTQA